MKILNLITLFSISFIALEASAMSRALVKCAETSIQEAKPSTARLLRLLSTQQRGIITATRTYKPKSPMSIYGLIPKRLESSKTTSEILPTLNDMAKSFLLGIAGGIAGIIFIEAGGPDKIVKERNKLALKWFIQQHPVSDDIRQEINNHQRDIKYSFYDDITIGSTYYRIENISLLDIERMALIEPMQKVMHENNLDKLDVNHMGIIKIKDFPYIEDDLYVVQESKSESIETKKISLDEIKQLVTFIEKTGFKFDRKYPSIARNHLGKIMLSKTTFYSFTNKMHLKELLDPNILEPDAYNWLQQQIKEKDTQRVQSLLDRANRSRFTRWAEDGVLYSSEIALS